MKNTENIVGFDYGYHPIGLGARERFLLRRKTSTWKREWEYVWKKYSFHITLGSAIFFVSALIYFVTTVFHLTDVAHAGSLQPQDVRTLEAACAYAGLYAEKIKNLDALQIACADNGTAVQFMDPNWNKKV